MEYTYIHNHQSRFIELFEGDEYPLIKLGDYTDFTWGDTNTTKNSYVTEGYLAYSASGPDGKLDHFDYDCEGIVLSAIGSDCGKTWFASGKWSCIKNTIRFWSTFDDLDNRFLYFATREKDFWPRRGGAQPFIPQGDARNCSIPLPPICLQRKFVEIAEQADKSKFDGFKSRFIEMFGNPLSSIQKNELKKLGDCCQINPRRPSVSISDSDLVSFVPMPAVNEDGYIDGATNEEYGKVKKGFTYFENNDVLFAKITPCMENGKGAIAEALTNGIGMGSTEFHVLRTIDGISNPYWLLTLTRMPMFREYAAKNMSGTGGQRRVGAAFLENFMIGLPSISEQETFETIYRQADKSKYYKLN